MSVTEKHNGCWHWSLNFKLLRHSELRYVGKRTQWVISPVQIALWTPKSWARNYAWKFSLFPLPRSY